MLSANFSVINLKLSVNTTKKTQTFKERLRVDNIHVIRSKAPLALVRAQYKPFQLLLPLLPQGRS